MILLLLAFGQVDAYVLCDVYLSPLRRFFWSVHFYKS